MGDGSRRDYTGDEDFDELLDKVMRIMKTKAVDYAKPGDRLAQFRHAATKYKVSMRQVLGIYMDKHIQSVDKWIRGEDLKGEPIEEKLLDNVVYSLLGYKIAKEERRAKVDDVDDVHELIDSVFTEEELRQEFDAAQKREATNRHCPGCFAPYEHCDCKGKASFVPWHKRDDGSHG